MAKTKARGHTKCGRDSKSKRLGVKAFGDEFVSAGSIIVRQRGTKIKPGKNVGVGRDYTLFAKIDGFVKFEGDNRNSRRVSVYSEDAKG